MAKQAAERERMKKIRAQAMETPKTSAYTTEAMAGVRVVAAKSSDPDYDHNNLNDKDTTEKWFAQSSSDEWIVVDLGEETIPTCLRLHKAVTSSWAYFPR